MLKMVKTLLGVTFTDKPVLLNVGASAFKLSHDWFIRQDLVIRTAAGGGGVLLVEGSDYTLGPENIGLSTEVTLAVGAGRNVHGTISVINGTYQTGNLYPSGKYVADDLDPTDWNIPILVPQPWFKNLAAAIGTTLFTGSCNTDVSMALKDTTKNFSTVAIGDIVRNTTSNAFATVLYKTSTNELDLDADIFPVGNEAYKVYSQPAVGLQPGLDGFIELTGAKLDGNGTLVADNDTLYHLKNSTGTVWTGLVAVGDWAMNLATGKIAKVTVVAAHDLTLQWDAFPNGNEKYMIFAGIVIVSDSESALNGISIPEMNIGGRYFGGGLTPGNTEDDGGQGHIHPITGVAAFVNYGSVGGTVAGGGTGGPQQYASTPAIGAPSTDGTDGTPRVSDHAQPRTLRATMIMRIK
jgi:hypothetical protein